MAKRSIRLEVLHSTFEENGISLDTVELNDSLIRDIKKYAAAVSDYRPPSYIRHPLGNINTEHRYQVTVQMLFRTIEGIVLLSGEKVLNPKDKSAIK